MSSVYYSRGKEYYNVMIKTIFENSNEINNNKYILDFRVTVSKMKKDYVLSQDIIDHVIHKVVDKHQYKYFISKENYKKEINKKHFTNIKLDNFVFMDDEPTLEHLARYFIFLIYALLKKYTKNKDWILSLYSTTLKLFDKNTTNYSVVEIKG